VSAVCGYQNDMCMSHRFKTNRFLPAVSFFNLSLIDYIIEKEPLVNKFISVPSDGGKVTDSGD